MKTKNLSPLRYPGGKSKLTNFIVDLIEYNDLIGCTYIEPFAGGAGAALALLFNNIVENIIINDCDYGIYSIWNSILHFNEEFCDLIYMTPVTIDEWYKQKEILKTSKDLIEVGFATFFLNRTNMSGIIKGGAIGGLSQKGKYKIDCRFNKSDLINRIRTIEKYRDRISVFCQDAEDFIRDRLPNISDRSFIYLDPPYYKKGPDLYTNFYNHEDHEVLSELVKTRINQPWMITYDNVEEISRLYQEYQQTKYFLNYSVKNKCKGQEIIIYSNNIIPVVSKNIQYCI